MESKPVRPRIITPGSTKRKAITISQQELIRTCFLETGQDLPLVIKPSVRGVNLVAWAKNHTAFIENRLLVHGAILFRDFNPTGISQFERFVRSVSGTLLEYQERSSPRSRVSENVYTSTDYPKEYPIFLHNENSYQQVWPLKVCFFCETPAQSGGETPIADCRRIYQHLDPRIREFFIEKQWMYVRNFGDGFGLPWQTVFQTTDRAVVDRHCHQAGISVEWKSDNRLRIRAVHPAVARHPVTGEMVWFNHATFFHVSTLEPTVRQELLRQFAEEDLPTNTYYGDGRPIDSSVLAELREAYKQAEISFPWEAGDILLVDNMLVAHGRAPYVGPRRILVAMAQPVSRKNL